jgi:hypothetical protein
MKAECRRGVPSEFDTSGERYQEVLDRRRARMRTMGIVVIVLAGVAGIAWLAAM